jgi:HSP20 family protein
MAIDLWRTRALPSTGLSRAVDRLFEDAYQPFYGGRDGGGASNGQTGYQTLPITIWETDDAFHAALLAPGLDEQSINVTLHEDTLSIEGELKFETPEGARLVRQEFGPTKFRRSLRFGTAVDPQRVEAIYRSGMLLLTMPKAEHAKPRQVQVQVAESRGNGAGRSAAPAQQG